MHVTIIGSGTGVPSLDRCSPCLLVETETAAFLLDSGPGSLRQLLKAGKNILDIDALAYSHFHIDHTADLVPFVFASKYAPGLNRTQDLTIIGSPGIRDLFHNLAAVYGTWALPEFFDINWIESNAGSINFKGITIKTAPMNHTDASIAYRIEDPSGKSMVYSGDTDYCDEIIALAHNADLLVLECSFPDDMKRDGHLTPKIAGSIAREAQCRKLVLTHFYPPCDTLDILSPVQQQFQGEAVKAEDLMKITL